MMARPPILLFFSSPRQFLPLVTLLFALHYSPSVLADCDEFCTSEKYCVGDCQCEDFWAGLETGTYCNTCQSSCGYCETGLYFRGADAYGTRRPNCLPSWNCDSGWYFDAGECKRCNKTASNLYIVFTILVFLLATLFVQRMSTSRWQMIRVKVLTVFLQCSMLTTTISIPWPKFAIATLLLVPMPSSDVKCVDAGINQIDKMIAIVIGPLCLMAAVVLMRAVSYEKRVWEQILLYLVLLWYAPAIQSAVSLIPCFNDDTEGNFLVADPTLDCQKEKKSLMAGVSAIVLAVGVGVPAFAVWQVYELKRRLLLDAKTPFAALYEWYHPRMPYFEAVQLVRRGLIILATSLIRNALAQAAICFVVNAVYLYVLEKSKPFSFFPSNRFRGKNLFHEIEVASTKVVLAGCVLAFVGSALHYAIKDLEEQKKMMTAVGVIFTVLNVSAVITLVRLVFIEAAEIQKSIPVPTRFTHDELIKEVGREIVNLENDWSFAIKLVENAQEDPEEAERRARLVEELPFRKSRLEVAIALKLQTYDLDSMTKSLPKLRLHAIDTFVKVLNDVEEAFQRLAPNASGATHRRSVLTRGNDLCVSLAREYNLFKVVAILEGQRQVEIEEEEFQLLEGGENGFATSNAAAVSGEELGGIELVVQSATATTSMASWSLDAFIKSSDERFRALEERVSKFGELEERVSKFGVLDERVSLLEKIGAKSQKDEPPPRHSNDELEEGE